jgi:hypothetical protein
MIAHRAELRAPLALSLSMVAALSCSAVPARADETTAFSGQVMTLPAGSAPLAKFDISFVDSRLGIYILADRSNAQLDVFSVVGRQFLFPVRGFAGFHGSNDTAGPNGLLTVNHREIWAGDGNNATDHTLSSVKVIDLLTQQISDTIVIPNGKARADEMAFDPEDQVLLVANDADSPPFITLISTKPGHQILRQIFFPEATNGIEQSQWSRKTGLFYLNIPEVNGIVGNGEVLAIDPKTLSIVAQLPVAGCEPGGLALGPDHDAFIGCSKDGTDNSARIINLQNGREVAKFPQITAMDEVWFDPGSDHYFAAASNNPSSNGGPELGIVDADSKKFDQVIPTGSGDHSVAADPDTNHVFVPFKSGASDNTLCHATGCIVVFGTGGKKTAAK